MERHIRILALLSRLWGALALLVGLSMFTLAAGAGALLVAPHGTTSGLAAGLVTAMFGAAGLVALLWGGVSLWSGMLIAHHRPLGRSVGLVLGVVNLLALPFGTALGGYALWVLLDGEGRRVFEPPAVS